MRPKAILTLMRQTGVAWYQDKASSLAAALAFYTIFSLAPILWIAAALAGVVVGDSAARTAILQRAESWAGPQAAAAVRSVLDSARSEPSTTLAAVFSAIVLLFGATVVFAELRSALHVIWNVADRPGLDLRDVLYERMLAFALVLGVGFFLLFATATSALLSALGKFVNGLLPAPEHLLQLLHAVVSFGLVTLLFAIVYKILPDVEIPWSDVWTGAAITALLFTLGKSLIGLYLGKASWGSLYGTASSVVIVLIWVYYSAQVFFLGAEFTKVYSRYRGSEVVPKRNAAWAVEPHRSAAGSGGI